MRMYVCVCEGGGERWAPRSQACSALPRPAARNGSFVGVGTCRGGWGAAVAAADIAPVPRLVCIQWQLHGLCWQIGPASCWKSRVECKDVGVPPVELSGGLAFSSERRSAQGVKTAQFGGHWFSLLLWLCGSAPGSLCPVQDNHEFSVFSD